MDWNKKNKWASLVAALVSFAGVAHADANDMQLRNLDNRVSALESKRSAGGIINPSVNPQVKDGLDLDIMAEFLYWKNSAQDNVIGQQASGTSIGSTLAAQGREIHASSNWAPGFRVGIGYVLPHDGWDMRLDYLRIRNGSAKDENNANGIIPVLPTGNFPTSGTLPTALSETGKAVLNMIDFEMGRSFYTSKFFTLRPFVGVRNMWYKEVANVTYTGGATATYMVTPSTVNYSNSNWHIGMRAGLDASMIFGAGFSMYGNGSIAVLYGNQNQYALFTANSGATSTSQSAFYKNSRVVVDIAAGFAYDVLLADDTFGLQIKTGWRQLSSTDLSAGCDSFAYQGWTFGAKLSF